MLKIHPHRTHWLNSSYTARASFHPPKCHLSYETDHRNWDGNAAVMCGPPEHNTLHLKYYKP